MKKFENKNILYNKLLNIRNNRLLRKLCLEILINNNLQNGEIASFDFVDKYPALVLKDGTKLISFQDKNISLNKKWRIPEAHRGALLSYILRFKYPHCLPSEKINTGIFPRRLFPSLIHRQHINTLSELPKHKRKKFHDMLTIRPGDRILELGPFVGFGTIRMSQLVGEKGQIVSVEADKRAHEILNLNIEKNNLQNVSCLNYAASANDSDDVQFYIGEQQANSLISEIAPSTHTEVTKGRTIESIINEANFEPNFIILTINGAELQALAASQNFLAKANPLRIISPGWYNDGNGKIGNRIVRLLISLGFEVAHTSGMHIFAYKQ